MFRFVGEAANCKIVFHESPHFDAHRKISKSLNNCANKQAFIVTLRPILPGEELRWKYVISQPYRMLPAPPSPAGTPGKTAANAGTPGQATVVPALSEETALPRAATSALAQRGIDGHDHTHAHFFAHAMLTLKPLPTLTQPLLLPFLQVQIRPPSAFVRMQSLALQHTRLQTLALQGKCLLEQQQLQEPLMLVS
jgi:hypothetical protein